MQFSSTLTLRVKSKERIIAVSFVGLNYVQTNSRSQI